MDDDRTNGERGHESRGPRPAPLAKNPGASRHSTHDVEEGSLMGVRRERKDALFAQFARVGKALASPIRLELIDLLAQGERSVESLARAADLALTSCSAHLQTLKAAHLVDTRRKGVKVYYRLSGPDVVALYGHLQQVAATHLADLAPVAAAYLGPDDTEAVNRDELLRRARTGRVTVLDVRPAEEYAAGHLPGAVSIPLADLPDRLAELPADTEIVAYCRGAYCVLSRDAARLLNARGRTARRLDDGILEWALADLPLSNNTTAAPTDQPADTGQACGSTGVAAGAAPPPWGSSTIRARTRRSSATNPGNCLPAVVCTTSRSIDQYP
jgi:rhodanese-related sulfurtransferase